MIQNPITPVASAPDGQRENRPQQVALEMHGVALGAMRDQNVMVAEDINWTVNAGEFWVVAGPQRSGKSDLLMLAGGLMPPTRGTYLFFGEAMPIFEEERLAERLRLGLVFDGGQLFNRMTLAENVALPLQYHRNLSRAEAGPLVQAMLELTELAPLANATPGAVARNWQKRAGLARALILEPDVLLLDNPLGGLDARHALWWLNFLEQLSAGPSFRGGRPMTVVVTTDDLGAWSARGHRFAVLNDKRFSLIGSREELARSAEPAVKELLISAATPPGQTEIAEQK